MAAFFIPVWVFVILSLLLQTITIKVEHQMAKYEPIKIKADDDGQRLDRWIQKHYPGIAFGQIQKALRSGEIRINSKRVKSDNKVHPGDEVRLPPMFHYPEAKAARGKTNNTKKQPYKEISKQDKQFIQSLVIYEDQDIIALNKPAGLATQGGSGIKRHVDGLLDALKKKSDAPKPKLIHRLDKDTSGVLILGKTPQSTRYLMSAFKGRDVEKIYLAVTLPAPRQMEGEIRGALDKQGSQGYEKMVVDEESGKSARTEFTVLDKAGKEAALVAFKPLTGRTHQIRVHAADLLETPILGDFKYGFSKENLIDTPLDKQLHLHAARISIPKERGGYWEISAPLPPHIQKTIDYFSFNFDLDLIE